MRLSIILFFLPAIAFAEHTCEFNPACNARINMKVLEATITAQHPDVEIQHRHCESAMRRADGTITEAPKPRLIEVSNIPNAVSCATVQAFLTTHNPAETDQEERVRVRFQNRDQAMRDLAAFDGSLLKELLDRVSALEAP